MAGRGFYVNFKVPELQEAINNIGKYDGKTAQKVETAVNDSTKNISKGSKRRVPGRSNLKKKIGSRFDKRTITGTVAARTPYAHLVEFGAGAATVTPGTGKKALTIDEFGNRNYASKANIPIRRPRPYLRPAFEEEKPNLIKNVTKAVQS